MFDAHNALILHLSVHKPSPANLAVFVRRAEQAVLRATFANFDSVDRAIARIRGVEKALPTLETVLDVGVAKGASFDLAGVAIAV